jgi:hypothetical protein
MIIFYSKQTGEIVGTIDGRVHTPEQLKMWIGDKSENERLIIDWKPEKFLDSDEKEITEEEFKELRRKRKNVKAVWEPQYEDKLLIKDIEQRKVNIGEFKISKGKFQKKSKEEIESKTQKLVEFSQRQRDGNVISTELKNKAKDKSLSTEDRLDAISALLDLTIK